MMVKLFGISHFVKMSMSEKEELLPTKRNFCDCCRNNREFSLWCRKGKAFCEHPFALRHQQPEKDKQNGDVPPSGKISADPHVDQYEDYGPIDAMLLQHNEAKYAAETQGVHIQTKSV